MNRLSQPDLHPDAEALSAFAEQALPAAEKTAVLAHLAECPRCREIVYLAQSAAELEASAPHPVPTQSVPARLHPSGAWLPKWGIAWIPAAALAGVGAVVVWVLLRPTPPTGTVTFNPPSESASLTAPPAETGVLHAPAAQPGIQSASKPAAPPTPPSSSLAAVSTRQKAANPEKRSEPPGGPTGQPAPGDLSDSELRALLPGAGGEPPAAPGATPSPQTKVSSGADSARLQQTTQARYSGPAYPQPLTPSVIQNPSMISADNSPTPAVTPALPSLAAGLTLHGQPHVTPLNPNRLAMDGVGKPVRLPNGLKSVSAAAVPGRLLAIDPEGAVFLSSDAGKSWKTVSPTWTGKALQVRALSRYGAQIELQAATGRLEDPTNPSPVAAVSSEASPASFQGPQLATPTFFRIVTDRHQSWVSPDGKLWTLQ